jgi:hypothetical protein
MSVIVQAIETSWKLTGTFLFYINRDYRIVYGGMYLANFHYLGAV